MKTEYECFKDVDWRSDVKSDSVALSDTEKPQVLQWRLAHKNKDEKERVHTKEFPK